MNTSYGRGASTAEPLISSSVNGGSHSFSVDASAIGNGEAAECLVALIRKLGFGCTRFDRFWRSFADESPDLRKTCLPEGVLVLGDLAILARRYARISVHRWVASVREARPYFIGLIRTRMDRQYINVAESLFRACDMRATICRAPETDFPECLLKASSALDPDSLVDVRYSPRTRELWVEFSDGLFGSVILSRLGLPKDVRGLMLQTATVGDNGAAVEILEKNGGLFRISASSIRDALPGARRPAAPYASVGDRVRTARERAGMSQSMLAAKTGIHQTRISRLEHGCHCPRLDTLERVATVLGCSVTELLSERYMARAERAL
jgi:DNA-binding XRE family transcriptional regulator